MSGDKAKNTKVVLIGSYPPPAGGNSTHAERLVARLAAEGRQVVMIDPRATAAGNASKAQNGPDETLILRPKSRSSLLLTLLTHSGGSIVHIHMSAGGTFYRAAPLLLAATRAASKRILSIHSGSWSRAFQALSEAQRRRATRVLAAFDDIICVNTEQKQVLCPLVRSRLHVVPAYLPGKADPMTRLPAEVEALRRKVDLLLTTSGFGSALYDYETVIEGVERAQSRVSIRLGLVVATYATWDNAYWPPVEARLSASSVPTAITKDLTPSEFLTLLAQTRLYLRGTSTDGDSVAVREAASAGAQVIATDAVPRPQGAALFPFGRADCLAEQITEAIRDRSVGLVPIDAYADNYEAIARVYALPRNA